MVAVRAVGGSGRWFATCAATPIRCSGGLGWTWTRGDRVRQGRGSARRDERPQTVVQGHRLPARSSILRTAVTSHIVSDLTVRDAPMNAKEMAATFGVSERTARRHIARGTTPDARRKLGRDGKTYAASRDSYRSGSCSACPYSALSRDLKMARNAVRRLARATAFSPDDLAELRTIATEAAALWGEWTTAVEAKQHARPGAVP
jgi:hypothetical protein